MITPSINSKAPYRTLFRSFRRVRTVLLGVLGFLLIIAIWEGLILLEKGERTTVPAPTDIAGTVMSTVTGTEFWAALSETLIATGIGVVIASGCGVVAGVVYGTFVFVRESSSLLIEILRPIPPVALLPVGLLLFGTGLEMKLSLIIYTAFWPIFIQTTYAMRDIEPSLLDMARIYRITRKRRFISIVLPSIASYVAVGLRLSVVGALIASIVTELIGGAQGLGYLLSIAQSTGQYESMYSLVLLIGFLGLLLSTGFEVIERKVLSWNPAARDPK